MNPFIRTTLLVTLLISHQSTYKRSRTLSNLFRKQFLSTSNIKHLKVKFSQLWSLLNSISHSRISWMILFFNHTICPSSITKVAWRLIKRIISIWVSQATLALEEIGLQQNNKPWTQTLVRIRQDLNSWKTGMGLKSSQVALSEGILEWFSSKEIHIAGQTVEKTETARQKECKGCTLGRLHHIPIVRVVDHQCLEETVEEI